MYLSYYIIYLIILLLFPFLSALKSYRPKAEPDLILPKINAAGHQIRQHEHLHKCYNTLTNANNPELREPDSTTALMIPKHDK